LSPISPEFFNSSSVYCYTQGDALLTPVPPTLQAFSPTDHLAVIGEHPPGGDQALSWPVGFYTIRFQGLEPLLNGRHHEPFARSLVAQARAYVQMAVSLDAY
jgi:hypothetical protein